MRTSRLVVAALLLATLGACENLTPDQQRALVGAGAGAVIADVTDNDVATGAVIGGAAGFFCDDLNVPGCVSR